MSNFRMLFWYVTNRHRMNDETAAMVRQALKRRFQQRETLDCLLLGFAYWMLFIGFCYVAWIEYFA